jgi:ribosomal protein L7/L12
MRQMETAMQALLIRLGIDPAEVMPRMEQQNQAIWDALLAGDKILAIKLYREEYGIGLKEAKDAVDAMERQNRGY